MSFQEEQAAYDRGLDHAAEMHADELREAVQDAVKAEYDRVIKYLMDVNVVRRDAFGYLVAMDHFGEKCVELKGLAE